MAENSTDARFQAAATSPNNAKTSLLAWNAMLPVLITSLFILYVTFRRVYKLCITNLHFPPSTAEDHRFVVSSMVSQKLEFRPAAFFLNVSHMTSGAGVCGSRASSTLADDPDIHASISAIKSNKTRCPSLQFTHLINI